MDDVIYRKDAIRVLNAKCKNAFNLTCGEEACECAEYMALRDLPSAQPERKTGKWSEAERKKSEVFFCSLCGGKAYYPWFGSRKDERKNECGYKFCPNCGADMRGEQDG